MANKLHPLIAAVINTLPKQGEFPRDERVNWLRMMAMALGQAYGAAAPIEIDPPPLMALPRNGGAEPFPRPSVTTAPAAPAPPRYAFFIDQEGKARRMNGDRINPNQLNGEVLYDFRGEQGDLTAIIWADDTRGIPRGLQIDISAVT